MGNTSTKDSVPESEGVASIIMTHERPRPASSENQECEPESLNTTNNIKLHTVSAINSVREIEEITWNESSGGRIVSQDIVPKIPNSTNLNVPTESKITCKRQRKSFKFLTTCTTCGHYRYGRKNRNSKIVNKDYPYEHSPKGGCPVDISHHRPSSGSKKTRICSCDECVKAAEKFDYEPSFGIKRKPQYAYRRNIDESVMWFFLKIKGWRCFKGTYFDNDDNIIGDVSAVFSKIQEGNAWEKYGALLRQIHRDVKAHDRIIQWKSYQFDEIQMSNDRNQNLIAIANFITTL